ncbi:FAD-dependent oxidoreductase [Nocardia rhizosphaerihabitans]|uniref:ferredoxin--NADP(+) reductase n=1 Tax=Nocardia rhizosphaerihabitans TaxID=1691570 RepID=A0ABQ2KE75_9NOCA|nr:FAD-dependent oxidoreductase [Nocardia rhizosphaerihabitans]GGN80854.1 putative ferredoxin/ferredoxin--NADP reductase [Nocardia rhizosphaerihabitans]
MAYVITQRCCNDATCIAECPVDCIRPTPDQPEFATAEMLYIDPDTCIDCGACADSCPVQAIFPEDELTESLSRYRDINAEYFQANPLEADFTPIPAELRPPKERGTLRVAIVGAGPSACYAAQELLERGDVEVDMFDRLPTPWGLVRAGVAPDHAGTKIVTDAFAADFRRDNFRFHLNVEVGDHISHDELLAHHHAVIYAVGASTDRRLGIPGEDLPGSHSATEFVSWYNGHPDFADREFDLSTERAVIVGNGNVALDIARILTTDPDQLATTDIADHALEALRHSAIREVVLLGRRSPAEAAYTSPEFLALGYLPDVDVVVDTADLEPGDALKVRLAHEYAERPSTPGNKRIVFRYLASPLAITGYGHVEALEVSRNRLVSSESGPAAEATGETGTLATGLVLRSIGYRGEPVPDLPFDDARGIVPNDQGSVAPGVYVTGWIKRGARGVIGTNKVDAKETVDKIIGDFAAGELKTPINDREALAALVRERQPEVVDRDGWTAIDAAERAAGEAAGRPRVKITTAVDLVRTAGR